MGICFKCGIDTTLGNECIACEEGREELDWNEQTEREPAYVQELRSDIVALREQVVSTSTAVAKLVEILDKRELTTITETKQPQGGAP